MALVGVSEYAPYLVFGLMGGIMADRFDRRRLMMAASALRMLVVALVPIPHGLNLLEAWHLAAVALIQSSASAFFTPARGALLVNVLPEPDYQRGSATFSATLRTARILGPLLGTVLLKVVSIEVLFLFDAVTFLGCILTTWAIRLPVKPASTVSGGAGFWFTLADTARRIGANHTLSRSLGASGLGMAVWTGSYVGLMAIGFASMGAPVSDLAHGG